MKAVVVVLGAPFILVGSCAFAAAAALGGLGATADVGPSPSASATGSIPPEYLALYQSAAQICPGLPWTILAAIGTVESSNGTSELPGVQSGANYAGAEGPMQFEPATFAEYGMPVPPGGADPPSPYDPVDAIFAAARLLCANGAAGGANLEGAVFAYNHSQDYVTQVVDLAASYASATPEESPPAAG